MSAVLISYDLVAPGQDYPALIEAIQSYGQWAKPLKNVWIISTNEPEATIHRKLVATMNGNDKLIVMQLSGGWAVTRNLDVKVIDWMEAYVKPA